MSFELTKLRVNLFVTGDLAFYAIVLGKEGMSPKWCHLCQVREGHRSDLTRTDTAWDVPKYQEAAEKVDKMNADRAARLNKEKSEMNESHLGVKSKLWWDFIPIEHYVVPLLHCLIGIGDNILTRFREIVSEHIEYIPEDELAARQKESDLKDKITFIKSEAKVFRESLSKGKKITSLEGKVKTLRKNRHKLVAHGSTGLQTQQNEMDEYLESLADDLNADQMNEDDSDDDIDESNLSSTHTEKLKEFDAKIAAHEKEIKELKKEKNVIIKPLEKAQVSRSSF